MRNGLSTSFFFSIFIFGRVPSTDPFSSFADLSGKIFYRNLRVANIVKVPSVERLTNYKESRHRNGGLRGYLFMRFFRYMHGRTIVFLNRLRHDPASAVFELA